MFSTTILMALAATLFDLTCAAPAPTTTRANSPSRYTQIAEYSHPNFFDGFTLYNDTDPTWGFVEYVEQKTAVNQDLLGWVFREETNATTPYVGVNSKGDAPNGRQSVRLTSKKIFDVGTLTVIDVLHMPSGAEPGGSGLWPAVWYLAPTPSWPFGGEIDIIEYVNPTLANASELFNAMTLHTGPGCVVERAPTEHLGQLLQTNCSYTPDGNLGDNGCSTTAPTEYKINNRTVATAGAAFNAQGGGVFVHSWTNDGIAVWLFTHDSLPKDIKNGRPDPSSWKQKPLAKFSGSGCDFSKAFAPQQLIINIDVCGQWAGQVYPGGLDACNAFAASHPEAYEEAYFEFGSIKMYSQS